jgi:prepilin-type N-terminal cleavage/methylation domain-containing protein
VRPSRDIGDRRAHAGFTLIEIMAVIVIFALIAAVALPQLSVLASQALLDDGRKLAATIDFAREKAQATGRTHRVVIDFEGASYWIEEQPRALLADPALAWAELEVLPLVAPRRDAVEFARVIGTRSRIDPRVAIASVETDAEQVSEGLAAIAFAPDGATPSARIWLAAGDSLRASVDVAALADPSLVVVADAQ